MKNFSVLTLLVLMMMPLHSCGKKTSTLAAEEDVSSDSQGGGNPNPDARGPSGGGSTPPPNGGGPYAGYNKVCFMDLMGFQAGQDEYKLEALFGGYDRRFGNIDYLVTPIENLESLPEICIRLYGTGSNRGGAIRFEYEDNFGGGELNFLYNNHIYSHVDQNEVQVIWMDGEGILELRGNRMSNGQYRGNIRFANFDPNQEYVSSDSNNQFWDSQYDQCMSGQLSFSFCFSTVNVVVYSPAWYDPETYSYTPEEVRDLAGEFLNGAYNAETESLGFVDFSLNEVISN